MVDRFMPNLTGTNALERQRLLVERLEKKIATPETERAKVEALPPTDNQPPQPTSPEHPGSSYYPFPNYRVATNLIWHIDGLAIYPTRVTYLHPNVSGQTFPVIAVSPGKFLDHPTAYAELLTHICRKGYIVMFVDTDTGPLDCEHTRMAREFLEAVAKTINQRLAARVSRQNKLPQIAWWGHSMGAKVQAIAAQLTKDRYYLSPAAVLANNFSNNNGEFCSDNALTTAGNIPANIRYSVIKGDIDDIAMSDPSLLYQAMPQLRYRQLITVVSYIEDGLKADHFAPLTDFGIPIGGKVDALDWWLYWKIAVGAFDYHFKNGSDKWAYGSERENGGIDLLGRHLKHVVEAENRTLNDER
jgi:Chlorophyllase enzyme